MFIRRLGSFALGTALLGALVVGGAGSASAHTPSVSASCSGVQLSASSYDGSQANRWTATVDGQTTSGTFGESLSKTIPVAQGGASTTWSATVEAADGSYRASDSGTVGPCGKPPVPQQPADKVETKKDVGAPDCTTFSVTTTTSSRTIPFVYDEPSNSWVPGTPGPWTVTDTQTRDTTPQECTQPPKPALSEQRTVTSTPDCKVFTVTTENQVRDANFVFTKGAWVQDGFTDWRTVGINTADATLEQCPPPVKPEPIVSQTSSDSQKCGDAFSTVTTATTTQDYVLDKETRTWSLAEPVVTTTTSKTPIEKVACANTVVDRDTPDTDRDAVLPDTGAPSWGYGLAAGLLLLCGTVILTFQRRSDATS